MSGSTIIYLYCDNAKCSDVWSAAPNPTTPAGRGDTLAEQRTMAREDGWITGLPGGQDYCSARCRFEAGPYRGMRFLHARFFTGSHKAGTAQPIECEVTQVTATDVTYRQTDAPANRWTSSRDTFADKVAEQTWAENPAPPHTSSP